jgi:ubiquinone/menaquinone biosynthesis C-methylase UbiE
MQPLESDQAKAEIARVFSQVSATYGQVGPAYFAYFGEQLVARAQLAPGMRVLDVASGRGAVLFPAAQAVGSTGSVTGIDLADGMVAETTTDIQQRGVLNATVQVMDGEHLAFPDAAFDAVTCGFALFFMPHGAAALAEFHRVLRPGGRLALSTWAAEPTPAEKARWTWFDDLVRRSTPPSEPQEAPLVRPFDTPEQLTVQLAEAGFAGIAVQHETVTFPYASPEEWWQVGWSHFFRRKLESYPPDTLAALQTEAMTQAREMWAHGELITETSVLYTTASAALSPSR